MAVNSFAYIEKALPKVIDKVFARESMTDALMGGSEIKLDFLDARTVKIFKLASTGLTGYERGGHGSANARGAAQSTTETFTLSQERYSEIPLDKLDTLDDGETVLAHLASEFVRTKVVPEFDTYRFSKLASYTNATFGNRVVETISANTIITKFNAAFKWMSEQKVPEGDQIIYVTPAVMEQIRNTSELYKKLSQSEYKGDVSFSIEKYEGRPIVVVPADQFYTDCNLLQTVSTSGLPVNKGAIAPTSASKIMNFMVVDKKAPIIIKKLDFAKVYDSTEGSGAYLGYAGYLLTNLYYHDLFVPDNKRVAIYCSVSEVAAGGVANGLLVEAEAGSAQGKTVIKSVMTMPAGMLFDKIYWDDSAITIGTTVEGAGLTEVTLGADLTPDASHNYFAVAFEGKIVAVSKDFTSTLPKHA